MAEITAALVKELREKTGAGLMDCKTALGQTGGNLEEAVDWLRKKGLAAAAKKAGRVAAEGLVGLALGHGVGAVVEINSETDFVARNDTFQKFVAEVAELARDRGGDVESLKAATLSSTGKSVADSLTAMIGTIGENMSLRRSAVLVAKPGVVAGYMHNALVPGLGKIGVLVALESDGDPARLAAFGKQLAMHVAAAHPLSVTIEGLSPAAVERERNILREQAATSGKAADVVEKMVEGRLRKFYEDSVLLEQVFVIDGKEKVGKVLAGLAKELGKPVKVTAFHRFALGEGIEKVETDLAAEVAKTLRG
ncbi:MAG: translation elongation factor Ts [Alphaproteobacteria bacterium]